MEKTQYVIDRKSYVLGKDKKGTVHYIKEVQEVVFPIILEIDRVCRKNKIKYFLIAGSAVGAVNHQGFVPWDDDIDVASPQVASSFSVARR